jgi:hypothetical protein
LTSYLQPWMILLTIMTFIQLSVLLHFEALWWLLLNQWFKCVLCCYDPFRVAVSDYLFCQSFILHTKHHIL